jgi:muramidase (phage lysozyme)
MSESAEEWKSTMSGMKTDHGVGKKPNCNDVSDKTDHTVSMKTDCNIGNKSTASGTKML